MAWVLEMEVFRRKQERVYFILGRRFPATLAFPANDNEGHDDRRDRYESDTTYEGYNEACRTRGLGRC